jgi:chromosome segregation ATPase
MEEDRLDRIEKGMVEFFNGMKDLREAQKRTDEQLQRTDEQLQRTDEQLQRTDEQLNRTDEQLRRTDEQLRRTDEQLQRTDGQLQKTIKKLDKIGEQLGDMGIVQGKVAEDLFYRNVKSLFKQKDMKFSNVQRNVKRKGVAEYDIVASDKDNVLIIEVKNKMERRMIDKFLTTKIPKFKQVFPQYKDYRIFGGVGSLVMQDDVGRYAEKKGLFVLTQNGESGAMLLNRQDFKAKEFY